MARVLTDWITAFLQHAEHSEAPEQFHFWTAVSTIAGAMRRKTYIDMGYFKWYPNFFIFFVAPPGIVAKSTTAEIGMSILRDIEGIRFGPASSSWQAFVSYLAESRIDFSVTGGELTIDSLTEPMSAITVVASELGTFLDPHNREQIDVLSDLWDCRAVPWKKMTKKDGEETIVNPWLNLIGCTTPAWVAENFSDYFTGGGLASRAIFVFSDVKRKLVAYPQRHVSETFDKEREVLLHDLREISRLVGQYQITEEAFEWGERWYAKHSKYNYAHIPAEKFRGYLARKQTHIHKIAMVLAASCRDELVITERELKVAEKRLNDMEATLPRVFGQMNREQEMVVAAEVLDIVRSRNGMPRSELYRDNFLHSVTFDTFEKILRSLIASKVVRVTQEENEIYVRPVKVKSGLTSGANDEQTTTQG